jgi:hypothetical protein
MHDPISALFVRHSTCTLAASALPDAPVLPDQRVRRRRRLPRRFARRAR